MLVANGCTASSSRQPLGIESHQRQHPVDQLALGARWRIGRAGRSRRPSRRLSSAISGTQLGLQLREQPRHLSRLHLRLIVIQQDVVGAVEVVEALDVAAGQLQVLPQIRRKGCEVDCAPGIDPRLLPDRRRARHAPPPASAGPAGPSSTGALTKRTRQPHRSPRRAPFSDASARSISRRCRPRRTARGGSARACPAPRRVAAPARRHHRLLVPAEQGRSGCADLPVRPGARRRWFMGCAS